MGEEKGGRCSSRVLVSRHIPDRQMVEKCCDPAYENFFAVR